MTIIENYLIMGGIAFNIILTIFTLFFNSRTVKVKEIKEEKPKPKDLKKEEIRQKTEELNKLIEEHISMKD